MIEKDSQLKKLQKSLTEILKEVDRVCRKNNISYILVGGTLLGAKRHEGFIPWDDDLDIAMLREDYLRFEKIAPTELKNELYFRNFHTDSDYYLPFGKVCKRGTSYITELDSENTANNEIFIDIFPLDYAYKEQSFFQKVQAVAVKGLKAVIIRKKKMNVKSTSLAVRIMQIIFTPFSTKTLMKWQENIMCFNTDSSSRYIVNNGSNYSYIKQTMPREIYFPTGEMRFEDGLFQVPRDTEYYLERIYGEHYMDLPPVEKRITHNIVCLKLEGEDK